jgi:hypothetical protein
MAEYLILAENITFKNNKLSCINVYDKLSTIAMPAEFKFDMVIMCGPNWTVGDHKLTVKAVGSNGKEISIGELNVNIPSEKFVYNAYANDLKILMDYSVEDLTIVVYDDGKEIITRTYPVVSMLVPQQQPQPKTNKNIKEETKTSKKEKELVEA